MTHFLFDGNVPVPCERPNWKTCPQHKGLTDKAPRGYVKSGMTGLAEFIDDESYLTRSGLGKTVVTEEEFLKLCERESFTLPIGLTIDETLSADMDRLTAIFGDMIAGPLYSRDDVVLFKRTGVDDGMVIFDVTYGRGVFGS